MNELAMSYNNVRMNKKREFNSEEIVNVLLNEPNNLDAEKLSKTEDSVIINLPKEEYMKKKITSNILRKFETYVLCKEDKLVFTSTNKFI